MHKVNIIFCFTFCFWLYSSAQDTTVVLNKIDAARSVLTSNPDLALKRGMSALNIASKTNNQKLSAYALNTIGSAYYFKNNPDSAQWYHLLALDIQNSINDFTGMGRSYANLGSVYMDKNQNDRAIKYFFLAEKKLIKAGYNEGLAKLYNSMGNLFNKIQDYKNSIVYYKKGILLSKELQDVDLNIALTINLANVFSSLKQQHKALELYLNSYNIARKSNNHVYYVMICNNISELYTNLKEWDKAKYYCKKGLESIYKNQLDDYLKISTYGTYATILTNDNNNVEAKLYLDSALLFLKELPDLAKEITLKIQLGKALHWNKHYDASFSTLNEALNLKDSLYQINLSEKLSELNTAYDVEKKESQIIALNESKRKQKIINYLLTGVGVITIVFLVITVLAFLRKKKDNKLIQAQKSIVEEKNKEITDSINYAKRIQDAILPSQSFLTENFSNGFVLYKPKDIVAGDFYWVEKYNQELFIAAADCTGHGVPGAFVSVICSSALSKALLEENVCETGKLLDRTRDLVVEKFSKSEEKVQDGMDISLCKLVGNNLQWSGANNPIWIVTNKELTEIKPNKQPIGKIDNPIPFDSHTVTVPKGSMIYLITDGFADQFGGEFGKKFKYNSLKKLLIQVSDKEPNQQKELLSECFDNWKNMHEQVDDVCILGFRC